MDNQHTDFTEKQTVLSRIFTKGAWVQQISMGLILFITLWLAWQSLLQVVLGKDNVSSFSNQTLLSLLAVYVIGLLLAFSMRLLTYVDSEGLAIACPPLMVKKFRVDTKQIKSLQVCSYNAQKEYGGWGIRRGNNGRCFTMGGTRGVMISMKDGTHILVGSQRADELAAAITALLPTARKRK